MSDASIDQSKSIPSVTDDFGTAGDYIELLKPRVMSLVVFTGLSGLVCAPGTIHPVIAFVALLCIAVGAGASGALNMWFDADIDARMERTKGRPIPTGRVTPEGALAFGTTLSIASVLIMGLMVNVVAGILLAVTIAFYVFVYTMWLKRSTPQNIVIGGAAGAFPPMIGWAAVTGSVSLESIALFAIIFMWTPPHFWALAMFRSEDYRAVNVPMLPVVAGNAETRRQILIYSVLLMPITALPVYFGFAGAIYALTAFMGGAVFLALAFTIWRRGDADVEFKLAKRLFAFSILYLFLLFAVLIVEQGLGAFIPIAGLVS